MLTKKTRVSDTTRKTKKQGKGARKMPSQARSQETVAVILEAAARVLETSGLEGYNTNAVSERAGVSVGSIYQYFSNKEAMTLGLIAKFELELMHAVHEASVQAEGKAFRPALTSIVRAMYRAHERRGALHRILEQEEQRLGVDTKAEPELRTLVARFLRTHRSLIHAPVRDATVDVITIMRSMVDAALQQQLPAAAAERRTVRALCGYLVWTDQGEG